MTRSTSSIWIQQGAKTIQARGVIFPPRVGTNKSMYTTFCVADSLAPYNPTGERHVRQQPGGRGRRRLCSCRASRGLDNDLPRCRRGQRRWHLPSGLHDSPCRVGSRLVETQQGMIVVIVSSSYFLRPTVQHGAGFQSEEKRRCQSWVLIADKIQRHLTHHRHRFRHT